MKLRAVAIACFCGALGACSSPPKVHTPDGRTRIPINTEASIAAYQADARKADEDARYRAALESQIVQMNKQVGEMRAYILAKQAEQEANTPKGRPIPMTARESASLGIPVRPTQGVVAVNLKPQDTSVQPQLVEMREQSIVYTTTHPVGVTQFDMPVETRVAMLHAAAAGKKIIIRGRTDSALPNPVDQRIALGRAASARHYLIENGIPRDKIAVFYRSAGGFAVDNTTAEGKARNRRVEVEVQGINAMEFGKRT